VKGSAVSGSIGSSGESPVQAYLTYSANEARYANANAAGNAQATELINYFNKNAASITSPSALLGNYKALSVVLGAFQLGSEVNSPALVKQLLTQDPTSKTSLAYRSGNAKFVNFATALQNWSPPPFSTQAGITSIVTAYKTNLFESSANTQAPGLQNALYFARTAKSITTLTQLQSDASLLAVAVTGAGLPLSAFDNLTFTQQTTLLKQKLNIGDLQKPSYVQHLAELYLVQQQLNSNGATPANAPGSIAALFGGSTSGNEGGGGLLSILQSSEGSSASSTTSLLGTTTTASSSLLSLFA
jgi:hypothetical protein